LLIIIIIIIADIQEQGYFSYN